MLDMGIVVCNEGLGCEECKTPEGNENYKDVIRNSEWFANIEDTAVEEEYAEFDERIRKFFDGKIDVIDLYSILTQ